MARERIVSLIPSATEIICALGGRSRLVGRSHECDYPESVSELPICTEPKFNPEGNSAEIHQAIQAFYKGNSSRVLTQANPLEEALSVYRVRTEVLKELRPDLIVTQSQCDVCAVSLKDVEQAVRELVVSQPQIVSLQPDRLSDIYGDISRVADVLGVKERALELNGKLKKRVASIQENVRLIPKKPRVIVLEWIEPLMAAGNWIPELLEFAGAHNLIGETGKHSPWMNWEELCTKNPEAIVISPCGFSIKRTEEDMHFLTQKPEWKKLSAVRSRNVFIVDGNQYFNRPGPRLVDSLEILAEIFHPAVFHFGYERKGWKRFL
ncbi:MAG: cobalamin-binding protein [Candidatus Omnitrophica bacterium]|nr:cobalamin-binding protein [Candidatus Omnitrophota bacterium]